MSLVYTAHKLTLPVASSFHADCSFWRSFLEELGRCTLESTVSNSATALRRLDLRICSRCKRFKHLAPALGQRLSAQRRASRLFKILRNRPSSLHALSSHCTAARHLLQQGLVARSELSACARSLRSCRDALCLVLTNIPTHRLCRAPTQITGPRPLCSPRHTALPSLRRTSRQSTLTRRRARHDSATSLVVTSTALTCRRYAGQILALSWSSSASSHLLSTCHADEASFRLDGVIDRSTAQNVVCGTSA